MSDVVIRHSGGEEATVENPEYLKVLLNIKEVAVDGEIYTDVSDVEYVEE